MSRPSMQSLLCLGVNPVSNNVPGFHAQCAHAVRAGLRWDPINAVVDVLWRRDDLGR